MRDVQAAGINLTTEQGGKMAKQILKETVPAAWGAFKGYAKWKDKTDWNKWYKEYRSAGGSTGFFGLEPLEKRGKQLERQLKLMSDSTTIGKGKRAVRTGFKFIEDVNSAVENGVRLATYKNAREAGFSKQEAANLSKELTVNFNRKGEFGTIANSFFLFFNAGIQGSARVSKILMSKKGQKIGAGIIGFSFLLAELMRWMGGDDDDGESYYNKIPEHVKERNMVFIKPWTADHKVINDVLDPGSYIQIPLPYGYNVFNVMGNGVSNVIHGESPIKESVNITKSIFSAFNPLGGDASFLHFISPTAVDPIVDLSTNMNFAGFPIKPEQPPFGAPVPESQLYWKSVSPISKALTERLNRLGGGNIYRPSEKFLGVVPMDISPEVADHLVSFFAGSMGRFVLNLGNLGVKVAGGEIPEARKIPFVRVFFGQQPEFVTSQAYYEAGHDLAWLKKEIEGGLFEEEDRPLRRLIPIWKATDKRIKIQRKRIEKFEQGNKPKKEIDKLRDKITKEQKKFIKRYKEAKK
jgi:hypothetical protein